MPDPLASQIPSPLGFAANWKPWSAATSSARRPGRTRKWTQRAVRGRYILGLLAPRGQTILPDDLDDLPAGGADTEQDGKADPAALQTPSMLPSAIGLSFNVDLGAEAIAVTARWGRYTRKDSETLTDDKGDPRRVWRREQIAATSPPFLLSPGPLGPWYPVPDGPEVYVRGICRRRRHRLVCHTVPGQRPARAQGTQATRPGSFSPSSSYAPPTRTKGAPSSSSGSFPLSSAPATRKTAPWRCSIGRRSNSQSVTGWRSMPRFFPEV